jgi:hypothetical protein
MAKTSPKRWSQEATEHSDALELEKGVFALKDPKKIAIAEALRRAQHSPQVGPLSFGDVDAHFLHQPRRQASFRR